MGVRLEAVARTAKLFTFATVVPLAIIFLFRLDADRIFEIFLLSFLAWMIWVVYQINLGQIESEQKVKEIQERRETMISGMIKDPD